MAVIYLRHAVHGAKVAISDMEAAYDKKSGWEEFDPTVNLSATLEANTDFVENLILNPNALPAVANTLAPAKPRRRPAGAPADADRA